MRLPFVISRRGIRRLPLALCGLLALASCKTTPSADSAVVSERAERPSLSPALRHQLDHWILDSHTLVGDADLDRYLDGISARMYVSAAAPTVRIAPRVLVMANPSGRARNYAITADKVYLSAGVLRELDYENEIAAAIALAVARVSSRYFVERAAAPSPGGILPFASLYTFSAEEDLVAVDDAIDALYGAGYDPRGMVSYLDKLKELGDRNAVVPSQRIPAMQERSRRAIAFYSPLKDPVIRSAEFFRMKKRMERL